MRLVFVLDKIIEYPIKKTKIHIFLCLKKTGCVFYNTFFIKKTFEGSKTQPKNRYADGIYS